VADRAPPVPAGTPSRLSGPPGEPGDHHPIRAGASAAIGCAVRAEPPERGSGPDWRHRPATWQRWPARRM